MVEPGASVSAGQSVMELETDKAVVEVPSSVSGTLQEIRVKEGDKIKVGQVIFTVDNGAGAKPAEVARVPAAQPEPIAQPAQRAAVAAAQSSAKPTTQPAPQTAPVPNPAAAASGASEFKLPELGENISQGDLVRLMIAPGARVSEGQPVMEL